MRDEEVRRLRAEMARRHRQVWVASITPGIERSNKLVDAKKAEPPEHLLQFTSASALANILTRHRLWLSRVRSSNDPKELDHAIILARQEQDRATKDEGDKLFREELFASFEGQLTDGTERRPFDPHICCFTEAGNVDLVAQWAMYGRDGSGFALKFKGKALKEKSGVSLVKISYTERQQRSHLRKLLAIGRETSQNASCHAAKVGLSEGWAERSFRIAAQAFGGVIALHAATMKAPEFAAEREWRLLHVGRTKVQPGVDARGPILRTYFEMAFEPDDLVSIMVGPVHADVNRPVVIRLLEEHGYTTTTVEVGRVALRTLQGDR